MKKTKPFILILSAVCVILLCSMAPANHTPDGKQTPSHQQGMGFVASYDFLPTQSQRQSQCPSNNIDRINNAQSQSSGSSTSTSLWQLTIFCAGTGSGQTTYFEGPDYDLCGSSIAFPDESLIGYKFIPDQGSQLTHLYVNNIDRINQVQSFTSGSSSSYSLWSFFLTNDAVVNPVFDQSSTPFAFSINITPNDPSRGYTSGSGAYNYLDPVTALATPYSGFYFSGWSNGITDNPYTFAATQDLNLQAIFLPVIGIDQNTQKPFSVTSSGHKILVNNLHNRTVRIYDIRGRLISFLTNTDENVSVEVPHSGIYLVVVDDLPARKIPVF